MSCPLCLATAIEGYSRDKHRDYHQCGCCQLVFVPTAYHVSPEVEKQHYDRHENDPADSNYRRFLGRLFHPLVSRLPPFAKGLDFGSGPGPTLSVMFEERGHAMAIYDIFYAPDDSVLKGQYDFVTATEVVEHLVDPGTVLDRLWSLVAPGGWLGLMTKLLTNQRDFVGWHYKNDPTHICFYSRETFKWLGQKWGSAPEIAADDVIIFHKCATPTIMDEPRSHKTTSQYRG